MIAGKLVPVLLLAAWTAAPADDGVAAKDLEGLWRGARFTEGKGEDPTKGEKLEFTFKGNTLVCRKASGAAVGEATFTIAADGKSIDATGTSGGYRGKTFQGIVKIDGDTLTWCTSGQAGKDQKRPGEFVANPGSAQYLIVVKRQKS